MKDNTIIGFQNFYTKIRDKLTPEERDNYKWLVDSLIWTPYEREMVGEYYGIYNISLIDGMEFKNATFKFNKENECFETEVEIKHPQMFIREVEIRNGVIYCIPDKIVKYIK